jgi:hypothetical protein
MAPTRKNLGIDRLSSEQRVALALEIWERLGDAHGELGRGVRSHPI